MREVFEALERLALDHFLTGSEAAALYGCVRQSFDTDIVVDLDPARFGVIERAFADGYAISAPIDYMDFSMGSIISTATAAKVDLILRRPSPWAAESMRRRRRLDHPDFGPVWVASLEDLVLAKLAWSEGTSELQLRDCGTLIRVNATAIDWPYVERWARALGLGGVLDKVRHAP